MNLNGGSGAMKKVSSGAGGNADVDNLYTIGWFPILITISISCV